MPELRPRVLPANPSGLRRARQRSVWLVFGLLQLASVACSSHGGMFVAGTAGASGTAGRGPATDGGRDGVDAGGAAGTGSAAALVHPGCLSTRADLDRMRAKVAAAAQPWLGSWNKLTANSHAQINYAPHPQSSVCAGSPCAPENYMTLANDAAAAYQLALRYQISGDTSYAVQATRIVDAWATTLVSFTGDSNAGLRAALYGYQLACAGELLRDYRPWDPGQLQRLLTDIFYPLHASFLQNHNGACDGNYWANWDLANMASVVAIGVFTDRRDIFEQGIAYFRTGAGEGSIQNAVLYVHPDGSGQWQESGRDQGHATLGPMLMAVICEIAWNQGVDLYGYAGSRFLLGSEYVGAYNLGTDVPYVAYAYQSGVQGSCHPGVQAAISAASRGLQRPGWEIIYNHYVNRMGLAAPFTAQYAAQLRPEGGGGDYGSDSGGFDSLGFTTLTHTLDPVVTGAHPTDLRAFVQGHQITLSWIGSALASGYHVKRASTSGGAYVTLATVSERQTFYVDPGLAPGVPVYYVVSAHNPDGESTDSAEVMGTPDGQIFGTVIGTSGSFGSLGATRDLAYDGSLENFFDGPDSVSWTGLDLGPGAAAVVSEVDFAPRKTFGARMVGGRFQGASTADFTSGAMDLFTVDVAPPDGVLTRRTITSSAPFRYLRYLSATGGYGNVAEIVFRGSTSGVNPPGVPTGVTATVANGGDVTVNWVAVAGTESYNLKRAIAHGGASTIVVNATATSFTDHDVSGNVTYDYVVSAINKMGESGDSAVTSITTP